MIRVILINNRRSNIWNISPRIRFSRHVYLVILDAKQILEIVEELDEIRCNVLFIVGSDVSW